MALPLLLAAAAVPSLYKGIKGLMQGNQADKLQLRDTTPAAFTEALGVARQSVTSLLPGTGQQINRLDAGQNNVLAAGTRAGTSSNSILGLLSSSDENRVRGLADLSTRSEAFRQQGQHTLAGMLQQQAQYQRADQQELDRNKAAFTEAKDRNIYGALDGASQVVAYGLGKMEPGAKYGLYSDLIKKTGAKVAAADGQLVSGPDDILSLRRKNRYGVPTYNLPLGSTLA